MILTAKMIARLVKSANGGRTVGRTWARLMMLRHGMVPRVEKFQGGKRFSWTLSQVFGVYLSQFLYRTYQTDPQHVALLLSHLTAIGDEQLDAVLRGGRCWVMVVGTSCSPALFFEQNITDATEELKAGLAKIGAEVVGVDVGQLWQDFQGHARAALAEDANVAG